MIVISDTSPLNYLVLIKAIDILPVLFEEVHVPTQVLVELAHSKAPQTVRQWASAPPEWVRVSTPTRKIVLPVQLDAGELEAIALALELGADAILIDDRKGRRAAEALGINAVGTVPVLEFAAERRLLELKPALEALRATTFYVTDDYIEAALKRDAARKLRNKPS